MGHICLIPMWKEQHCLSFSFIACKISQSEILNVQCRVCMMISSSLLRHLSGNAALATMTTDFPEAAPELDLVWRCALTTSIGI